MKYLFILSLASILVLSCKHDHSSKGHSHDGENAHAQDDHSGHDHNGHDHDGHDHSGHDHDGHDHSGHDHGNHDGQTATLNTLTAEEVSKGWTMLFDGKSISEWRGYKEDISSKWVIDNGTLHFDSAQKGKGGDIISKKKYGDFELSLEWKIEDCGNSGLFWNVVESEKYDRTYKSGPEMQILDNKCHPDAKIITHRAGDLYDMIESSVENVKPAMQWNHIQVRSKNAKYEFYQNGAKVVEFTMHTPEWDAMVAKSKFKDLEGFGKAKSGHLALQDHGNKVWFRNIKIREI